MYGMLPNRTYSRAFISSLGDGSSATKEKGLLKEDPVRETHRHM